LLHRAISLWKVKIAVKKTGKKLSFRLALARFVAAIGLVDDVNAALAPDNLVVAVTGT
jgi:hypothetical protein